MNTSAFLITSLIIILIPGTGVIYTVSLGMSEGKKKAFFAALGCTAGILPHLCISIVLSSLLMQMDDRVFLAVKYIGVLYLIYLGVGMIFSKGNVQFSEHQAESRASAIIRRGVLINLLNPKLTLFFFSFLPQYVSSDSSNYMIKSSLLGLLFMVLTFIVFIGYGFLAGTAKEWLCQSPKRMSFLQKCFGITFIAFAIKLAL